MCWSFIFTSLVVRYLSFFPPPPPPPFRLCTETAERFAVLLYRIRMLLLLWCPSLSVTAEIFLRPLVLALSVTFENHERWYHMFHVTFEQVWKVHSSYCNCQLNGQAGSFCCCWFRNWSNLNQQQNWPPGLDARVNIVRLNNWAGKRKLRILMTTWIASG
jgi:hypothetical protein